MKARGLYTIATLEERNKQMAISLQHELVSKGMDEPFPASPTRPPRLALRFYRDNQFIAVHSFYGIYAAARFVQAVIGDEKFTWDSDTSIITSAGIRIVGEYASDLDKVMEHEDNRLEEQWVMPAPYPSYVHMITRREPPLEAKPALPPKPSKEPRSTTKRRKTEGLISIAQIADELKMTPRQARGILRDTSTPKPASGSWEWDEAGAANIRKLLEKNK